MLKALSTLKEEGGELSGGEHKDTYDLKMKKKVKKTMEKKEAKAKKAEVKKFKKLGAVAKMIATKLKKKKEKEEKEKEAEKEKDLAEFALDPTGSAEDIGKAEVKGSASSSSTG